MEVSGLHSRTISLEDLKQELIAIAQVYQVERSRLSFYGTDKQIREGLTEVIRCAGLLRSALTNSGAVLHELHTEFVTNGEHAILDTPEATIAPFDQYVAGIGRIEVLARNAIRRVVARASEDPETYAKKSAAKPEMDPLVESVLQLWLGRLARKSTRSDGRSLQSFLRMILSHTLQREVSEDTAAAHLKKARRSRLRSG